MHSLGQFLMQHSIHQNKNGGGTNNFKNLH